MSQKAYILEDGKRTGLEIEFTDDHELKYKGNGPKKWFEWVEKNGQMQIVYAGHTLIEMLPVRRETFWYFVAEATSVASEEEGKDYDYKLEGVPSPLVPLPPSKGAAPPKFF